MVWRPVVLVTSWIAKKKQVRGVEVAGTAGRGARGQVSGGLQARLRFEEAARFAQLLNPLALVQPTRPGATHSPWCNPLALVQPTRPGATHSPWCNPPGLVQPTRPGATHPAWCNPLALVQPTRLARPAGLSSWRACRCIRHCTDWTAMPPSIPATTGLCSGRTCPRRRGHAPAQAPADFLNKPLERLTKLMFLCISGT